MIPEPIYVTYTPPRIHVRRSKHRRRLEWSWQVHTDLHHLTYDSWECAVEAAALVAHHPAVIPTCGLVGAQRVRWEIRA